MGPLVSVWSRRSITEDRRETEAMKLLSARLETRSATCGCRTNALYP